MEKMEIRKERSQQTCREGTLTHRKNVTPREGAAGGKDKHQVIDADAAGIIFYKH